MWVESARAKYGSRIRIGHDLGWLQCVPIHPCRFQLGGTLLNHIQLLWLEEVSCAEFVQRLVHLIPIQFGLF